MTKIIETEYKLELTEEEFQTVEEVLEQLEFSKISTSVLDDYFFDINKFDDRGWNFTRLRVLDNDRVVKTIKQWGSNSVGERIRIEEETDVNKLELDKYLKNKKYLSLHKERIDYKGEVLKHEAIISLDKVRLSNEIRYFIECELKFVSESESHRVRADIREWLLTTFHLTSRPEGVGMMRLVLQESGII